MKKIIFLCAVAILALTTAFAVPGPGAPEKIKEVFCHNFPQVTNPVFFSLGNAYTVFFKRDTIVSEKVYLNLDGAIIKTIKYYKEQGLEPFLREEINKKYKGKTIFGISEVQSNSEHFYKIVLQDDKNWFIVKSDGAGSTFIEAKYNKG